MGMILFLSLYYLYDPVYLPELQRISFLCRTIPKVVNMTWEAQVPKIEGVVDMKDFRPISMVHCLYKVIAKVLSRRIREVMEDLVRESQSAFVKGRQIMDRALVANEVVYWVKKARKRTDLLKLDFQKAYEMVDWNFLDHVLESMGFCSTMQGWIHQCISTTSMSLIINGSLSNPFKMHKGLRQGDPLSPFLFVLVMEVFNKLLCKARELRLIEGLEIGANKVEVSHLQFDDDTLLFCSVKK